MSKITEQTTVHATPEEVWAKLIEDPNHWGDWLTSVRKLEATVRGTITPGLEFPVLLGKMSGKILVTEVAVARQVRWKAGPAMMLAMGMGMKGTFRLEPNGNGGSQVTLEMKSPMGPMGSMMMRMMAGLDSKDEMTRTIGRVKELAERQSPKS
ncbi:MAG: SRPBCC family protein [Acidimicrobiales bacterium]